MHDIEPRYTPSIDKTSYPSTAIKLGGLGLAGLVTFTGLFASCEARKEPVVIDLTTVTAKSGDTATGIVCDTSKKLAEQNNMDPNSVQGCVEAGQSVGGLWPDDKILVSVVYGPSGLRATAERSTK